MSMKIWKTTCWTALSLALLAASLPLVPAAQAAEKSYGDGVQLEEATPIAAIVADPAAFEGKKVRVEGKVSGVCPKKGCWMDLKSEDGEVRIKVEDDVIVFPAEAEGGHAVAEGVVEIIELNKEQYTGWKAHEAEELGQEFDPASIGDGPYQIVQIRGEGAVIEAEGI